MASSRLKLSRIVALAAGTLAGTLMAALGAAQAGTPVKVTLDWAFQGPQAPFLLAAERGYFTAEGLDVTIDRGEGSGAVPPRVASGAYDVGFGDINPMIRFVAEKGVPLQAVAVLYDASPLSVIALKKAGVTVPKDLAGKRLAAPETDSGRQIFPAFAKAAGIDPAAVTWQTVSPQLRETMLVQGQVDAISGFLTTGILTLKAAGVKEQDMVVLRYRDYGVTLYSNALITSKAFAQSKPEALAGFVRAVLKAHIEAVKDPDAAIAALKKRDPLIDPAIEKERMLLAFNELMLSPAAKANGLGGIDPARMQAALDILKATYGYAAALTPADVFTDSFLPPKDARTLP